MNILGNKRVFSLYVYGYTLDYKGILFFYAFGYISFYIPLFLGDVLLYTFFYK